SGWRISCGSRSSIRTMWPGSWAFAGGSMLAAPRASRVTRSRRLVAARTTKPSFEERLNATANGFVLKSFLPTGSKLTPTFMLSVGRASSSRRVSIEDRQLWTFTLKRNGPFGDSQVLGTYAMDPRIEIDSSRLGNAPVVLSKTGGPGAGVSG